jgi:hypothetical protein
MRATVTLKLLAEMTPTNRNRLIVLLVLAIPVAIFVGAVIYKGLIQK